MTNSPSTKQTSSNENKSEPAKVTPASPPVVEPEKKPEQGAPAKS